VDATFWRAVYNIDIFNSDRLMRLIFDRTTHQNRSLTFSL